MAMQVRNTILIVDDMATNRIFMKNVLKYEYELLDEGMISEEMC